VNGYRPTDLGRVVESTLKHGCGRWKEDLLVSIPGRRLHETYAIVQSVQGQQRISRVKGRQRYFFLLQSVTLLGKEKQGGWAR
jgi:hypothetical protein